MNPSERTRVLQFLKRHVIGRAVGAAPVTTHTDHDLITGAYEEDALFSSLVETANGFSFDMTTLARGTRYVHDKSGKKLLAEGTLNAVRVIRYEMTERKSSGQLVGFARFVSSTNTQPDPVAGTVFVVRMRLKGGVLEVEENMAGYADFVSANGTFKPRAVDGKYSYAVKQGKLAVHCQQTTFDVDPKTLRRTPTADRFPVQVSHEIQFPPQQLEAI